VLPGARSGRVPILSREIPAADPCPPVSEEIAACAAGRQNNMLRANTSMLRGRLPLEFVRSAAPRHQLRSYQNIWLGPTKSSLDKPNRSLFYVPGSSQKMIDKAWTLKPDNIVPSLCGGVCSRRLSILKTLSPVPRKVPLANWCSMLLAQ
jgi:hypothetical protein